MSLIALYYVGSIGVSYNVYRLKKTKIKLKKKKKIIMKQSKGRNCTTYSSLDNEVALIIARVKLQTKTFHCKLIVFI